jgi:hypothetical protein
VFILTYRWLKWCIWYLIRFGNLVDYIEAEYGLTGCKNNLKIIRKIFER